MLDPPGHHSLPTIARRGWPLGISHSCLGRSSRIGWPYFKPIVGYLLAGRGRRPQFTPGFTAGHFPLASRGWRRSVSSC